MLLKNIKFFVDIQNSCHDFWGQYIPTDPIMVIIAKKQV